MSGFYNNNDAKFTQEFHNAGIAEISSQFYPLEVEADINHLTDEVHFLFNLFVDEGFLGLGIVAQMHTFLLLGACQVAVHGLTQEGHEGCHYL